MTLYEFILNFFNLFSAPIPLEYFFELNEIVPVFSEFFFSISVFLLLMFCLLISSSNFKNFPLILTTSINLSVLIILLSLILLINYNLEIKSLFFNNTIIIDKISMFSKLFIYFLSILSLFILKDYLIKQQINSFEYLILILFSVLGLIILCSANDFITAYLSIEIQSLSFYLLAAYKKNSVFSTEAGLKYFILGSFSSCMFLLGSSLIYGISGTTNFEDLKDIFLFSFPTNLNFISEINLLIFGLIFILISLFFKLSIAPFHIWSPDVYENSLSSSTLIFAIMPKLSLFVLFIRIFNFSLIGLFDYLRIFFVIAALLSVIVGSFTGLEKRKMKSLLAYSSINHMGYLLLSFSTGLEQNLIILYNYLIIYTISSIFIWTILLNLNLITVNTKKFNKDLSDFSNLFGNHPLIAFIFSIAILSLAGFPPLIGFYAKLLIFLALIENTQYFVSIIAILCSVVSAFYYIRIVKIIFFEKKIVGNLFLPLSYNISLIISIGGFFFLILFLDPNIIYLFSIKVII